MFKLIGLLISLSGFALLALVGSDPTAYLDPIAAVVMFGTVFGGTIYTYGNQSFRFFSFSYKDKIPTSELFSAMEFYNYLAKLTFVAAIISLLVSSIVIMATINNGGEIKTSLNLALLTCIYGLILSFLIIMPIKHNIIFKATSLKKRQQR